MRACPLWSYFAMVVKWMSHLRPVHPCPPQWIVKRMPRLLSGSWGASKVGAVLGGLAKAQTHLPWSSKNPPPPTIQPMLCFLLFGSPQAFSPSHWVTTGLRPDSHPTKSNTLLLTYLLKSTKAFQKTGMDCFFMHLHTAIPEAAAILTYPQNYNHILVAAMWTMNKQLHFAL